MRALKGLHDLRIMICENTEQGNPAGYVVAIEVEHPAHEEVCLRLNHEQFYGIGTPFAEYAGRLITIHGYDFKYSARHTWVGNLFWNEYALPVQYAVGLLNVLRRTGQWYIEEAYTELFEKWRMGYDLTCADFGFADIPEADQNGIGFHRSGPRQMEFWPDKADSHSK